MWAPQEYLVGLHSHYDLVRPVRTVPTAGNAVVAEARRPAVAPVYAYDGRAKFPADYLGSHPTTGLLVARDDTILDEHYQYGRKGQRPHARLVDGQDGARPAGRHCRVRFSLRGIRGQAMIVDPRAKVVIVHTAVRTHASFGPVDVELSAVALAVLAECGLQ